MRTARSVRGDRERRDHDPRHRRVNVTLTVQLAASASVEGERGQSLVWAKSPVVPRLEMVNGAVPVLVSVTICSVLVVPTSWSPKVRLVEERETAGAGSPTPVRLTVSGLLAASEVMVKSAVRVPKAVGVKVTSIVQLAPPATLLPQVLVWAKSPLSGPVIVMLVMVKGPPVLLRVTVCATLVVFMVRLPKSRLAAERTTLGRDTRKP